MSSLSKTSFYEIEDLNKTAVVVGVGPGLSASVCRRFAREGYAVAMLSRRPERLAELAEELKGLGGRALAVAADAADGESLRAAFARVTSELGAPGVLVYNAGGFTRGGIVELDPAEFERAWKVSTLGALHSMQAVLPAMAERGAGTIIFTGATASLRGGARFAGFACGKVSVRALAQSAAREYGPQGVHISHVVIDGMINEPKVRSMFPDVEPERMLKPEAIAETYWHLHKQDPSCWTHELEVRPSVEKW